MSPLQAGRDVAPSGGAECRPFRRGRRGLDSSTPRKRAVIRLRPVNYSGVNAGVSEGRRDAAAAKYNRMIELVDEMLDLHRRLTAAKSDADRTRLERAIVRTDLYGLSGRREPTAFHLSLTPDLRSGGQT